MDLGRETVFVVMSVLRVLSPNAEHRPACAPWGEVAKLCSGPRTRDCQTSVPGLSVCLGCPCAWAVRVLRVPQLSVSLGCPCPSAVLVPRLLLRGGSGPQAAG